MATRPGICLPGMRAKETIGGGEGELMLAAIVAA
tara:strand:- start:3262 stop:3363 length:102 start_codon:yes stop_codon:yes gene_type:complete